jgi:hypothetical protein
MHLAVDAIAGIRGVTREAISDAIRANLKALLAPATAETMRGGEC